MTITIRMVGQDRNKRIWGYLQDSQLGDYYPWPVVKLFWGRNIDCLYFKTSRRDMDFHSNLVKKSKKYNVWDTSLNNQVLEQYEMHCMVNRLCNVIG